MSNTWAVPSYSEDWTLPGYTEEREIGHGASGKVVKAVHDESGQTVAVKYLSPLLVHDSAFMWGFRADAQMLRELGVPQVVQVYDYVEQPGQGAAIVMELVNGVSLNQLIERQGPTGPEAACTVLKDALLGLSAAHALGVVHRDYKTENVIVDSAGNTKLVDFGVAVRWGKQAPAAGTPLFLAPEEWHGAPASPATDIYAATAVFYECLAGKPPFSGKLLELQEQHVTASVPLERIDARLQGLIARGMAKNPAGRPPSAIAFVSELEALTASVYEPGWEERGRGELAQRAAAILPLLLRAERPNASARSYASTWEGGGRKTRIITVAAITAVIVVALGAVAGAVVLKGNGSSQASLSGNSTSQNATTTVPTSYAAVANVTPPVRVTACTAPSAFTYDATISATGPGTMKYQWVYSSGKPGPVQTVSFTGAGKKVVTGETLSLTTASSGWGKINLVSPSAKTLDEASYQLLCSNGNNSQVTASASVQVPSSNVTCGSPVPTLTATGAISDAKTGAVTYYWAQSDGAKSAPGTLDFTAPGTLAVAPLAITPAGDPGTGEAVLVVTSPVTAASGPATYTLSCTEPKPKPSPPTTSPSATSPSPSRSTTSPSPSPSTTSPSPSPSTTSPSPSPSTTSPSPSPSTTSPSPSPSTTSPSASASPTLTKPSSPPASASASPAQIVSSAPATTRPATPALTASASAPASASPTASATLA
ncbi:MAG TPA: protein kinase [Trebonia sp.]|nr:protein kinase [Trebonia sp.]